jgi:hypothetical protein
MERQEMVRILEGIIRDEGTNPTARCTAIRTLREIQAEEDWTAGPPAFLHLYQRDDN